MATSSAEGAERAGELYHGIPCRVRCAGEAAAAQAAWAALERIDAVFNAHRADSELGRINAAGPGVHRVSPWLADCLALAGAIEAGSGGAWSAAMLPLVRLWREAARAGREPDADAVARCADAARDGWRLAGDRLEVRRAGIAFDLGGIAKGFAVDRAVEELRARGVDHLLVQVGGETACLGAADANGRPHRIGIPHPDDPDGAWCALLTAPADGMCGSTSGDYRLGVEVAGVRRHHLLDARTGRPADNGVVSATCVFSGLGRNALADGLSGALTVLGPAALPGLCAGCGCEAMLLRRDPQRGLLAAASPGWSTYASDG